MLASQMKKEAGKQKQSPACERGWLLSQCCESLL